MINYLGFEGLAFSLIALIIILFVGVPIILHYFGLDGAEKRGSKQ